MRRYEAAQDISDEESCINSLVTNGFIFFFCCDLFGRALGVFVDIGVNLVLSLFVIGG